MTPEELAHWRYRVAAIQREIEALHKDQRAYREFSRDIKHPGLDASVEAVRKAFARRTIWDDKADELDTYLKTNQYLLEEARYMIELGEVTCHGPLGRSTHGVKLDEENPSTPNNPTWIPGWRASDDLSG